MPLQQTLAFRRDLYSQYMADRDFTSVVNLHTPDTKFIQEEFNVVQGRPDLYQFLYQKDPTMFAGMQLEPDEVLDIGNDFAVETGYYTIQGLDGADKDYGKYMLTWKKELDGEWYIHYFVSHTDAE